MPKIKIDALDEALEAVAALSAPRTQAEWRKASTALRTARRITLARKRTMTIQIMCGGSHRYLYAETWRPVTGCYTVARGLGSLGMIRHHAALYRQGSTKDRVADARYFASVCRSEGPVPLPDTADAAGVDGFIAFGPHALMPGNSVSPAPAVWPTAEAALSSAAGRRVYQVRDDADRTVVGHTRLVVVREVERLAA